MTTTAETRVETTTLCRRCEGTGEVWKPEPDGRRHRVDCAWCNGHGHIPFSRIYTNPVKVKRKEPR